nr:ubiquitin-activating enzyme E1 1-like isoform X2 [Tanacetum cinerariifolium]
SGALGCEFLKNLALMGVSCGTQGKLIVTDDDVIEKSNLSMQFLFCDWNIGKPNLLPLLLQLRYVDQRCLYFQKPLLKSGTLGAKCNTRMVIPHLTENYGTSRDPLEKQAPMFEYYFANRMKQLIFTFLSILRAETFGIPSPDWAKNPKKLSKAIDQVIVLDFQPKQGVKIDTDKNVTNLSSASIDYSAVIDELIKKLESRRKVLSSGYVMKPIQFEKDDDTNYHMDFIAGLANMREKNYSNPDVDKLRAKFIVGRIILAIATSTAMATGLVYLELFKVIDEGRKVEDYLNTFANLALSLFSMVEPVPLKVIKHQDLSWTVWDMWTIKGNPTLRELIKWLADKGLDICNSEVVSCSQGTVEPHGSIGPLVGGRAIAQWNIAESSEVLFDNFTEIGISSPMKRLYSLDVQSRQSTSNLSQLLQSASLRIEPVSSEAVSSSQGTVELHGSIGALAGGRAIAQWNTADFSEVLFR